MANAGITLVLVVPFLFIGGVFIAFVGAMILSGPHRRPSGDSPPKRRRRVPWLSPRS